MNKTRNSQSLSFRGRCLLHVVALCFALTSGCALSGSNGQGRPFNKVDPYEQINRKVFKFNDVVDNYVAEPISDAYRYITPQFLQTGIANVFTNLKNINVVVNDLFQGKYAQGADDTGRFTVNTTLGLLGFFDVAKEFGLQQHDEDFEQTLAVWGFSKGPYLVIPFLGPTTVRGIPGAAFDTATNPTTYVATPFQALSMLNARANAEGALKFIDEAALDPYVFTRESFLQWRESLATDGQNKASASFDDEFLGEEETENSVPSSKKSVSGKAKNGFVQASESFTKVQDRFDRAARITSRPSLKSSGLIALNLAFCIARTTA